MDLACKKDVLLGQDLSPQEVSKQELAVMDTARKKGRREAPGRTPPPPAVARRNARERNRVKQVNNGFANLRQHIPNAIAAAFESGRNGNKKLSKVETLRMAVEYIRSLEDLLEWSPGYDHTNSGESSSSSLAHALVSSSDEDSASLNSTPPPTLLEESLCAKKGLLVKFKNEQCETPLSPGIYSESSLSPGAEFIPVFNIHELSSSPPVVKVEDTSEEMRILCHNLIMLQADTEGDLGKQLNVNELISW